MDYGGLSFFYCGELSLADRQTSVLVLRSLLQQLVASAEVPDTVLVAIRDSIMQTRLGSSKLDISICTDWLLEVINSSHETTFVLDGVDKLSQSALSDLVSALEYVLNTTSSTLRIFLTSCDMEELAPLRSPSWGALFTITLRHWVNDGDGYGSHVWWDMEQVLNEIPRSSGLPVWQMSAESEGL